MRNVKLLMINTVILTVTGFLMRTISVAFNVYLTNRIGSAGIGLFQLIMAVYGLVVTFASAGIKLGATRLVTDSLSGKGAKIKDIMSTCIRYGLATGFTVATALYLCSGTISRRWICDVRAERALQLLAISLPPVAMSAALSGYFTARKTLIKYAGVQLAEQTVKIIVTVVALTFLLGGGTGSACAAIAVGMSASEIVSCSLSFLMYSLDKKVKSLPYISDNTFGKLLHIAVPDAVGSGMRSVLLTIEHLLIPVGFRKSGQSAEEALGVYGNIHGMALPIVLYPSAVLTSLAGLLVPELARYHTLKAQDKINSVANTCLRMTVLFSAGTSAFLFFFSSQISCVVYESGDSAFYIKLLSLLVPVMYMDMIVDGMLKGLDQQLASMRYNIIDSGLCVILVYTLLPKYSIKGYIFILFISEIINFTLSINRLSKVSTLKINLFHDLFKPAVGAVGSCAVVNILLRVFGITVLNTKPALAVLMCVAVGLYAAALYGLGCIKKEDTRLFQNAIRG